MKKISSYIFTVIVIISACNKNNASPEYYGTASMTVNGVNWQSDKVRCLNLYPDSCFDNKISLALLKFSSDGYLREEFYFSKILPGISWQKIYPENFGNYCNDTLDAAYNMITDDGDVILAAFTADSCCNNYLNVEKYNSATKELSGTFEVTFVLLSKAASATTIADTVRITNGKFSTKILN